MRRKVNGKLEEIPSDIMEFIIKHINDIPRAEMAKRFGISRQSIYKIARANGGKDMRRKFFIDDIVIKYYPTMSSDEMAKIFGHSKSLYIKRARELGVVKTEEFKHLTQERNYNNLKKFLESKEGREKLSRTMKRIYRMERFRVDSGMRQKTALKVRIFTKGQRNAMAYLRRRQYIQSDSNDATFYFNSSTKRSNEDYFVKKYGFKFKQCDNENNSE